MPYLYRRKRGLVDLMIDKTYRKVIEIRDGASEGGFYGAVIKGQGFEVEDPASGSDSSNALATALGSAISTNVTGIEASVSGNLVFLLSTQPGRDFSLSVYTTDTEGEIFVRDANPEAYRVDSYSNWDQAAVPLDTIPQIGKATSTVGSDKTPPASARRSYVRYRFAFEDHSLSDDDVQFLRYTPLIGGVPGTTSPFHIILTPEQLAESHTAFVLAGTVPSAADSDSALEFILPYQTSSFEVKNTGGVSLFLSFGTGASELEIPSGESFRDNRIGTGDLRLRGDGATTTAYVYVTVSNNKSL